MDDLLNKLGASRVSVSMLIPPLLGKDNYVLVKDEAGSHALARSAST